MNGKSKGENAVNGKIAARKSCGSWLRWYTLMFLAVALPMALCLLLSGKTFLWGSDAYLQQYTTLRYTGEALRRLFSGGGFSMLEFSLGQGLDAIGTLGYYGLTDPLQWLGALFTGRGLELYYHFLIFLYIYLSGMIFCIYSRRYIAPSAAHWQTALSGLIYATCGYQTIGIIKNPYYAAGGIYLLLMLIAVECVLRSRKWAMMTLVTLLMLMANFYLAYQTTLLTIFYILIRLCFRIKKRGIRKSAGDGFILLGAYALGFALSMVFLLPSALNFLSCGRTEVSSGYTASLLHFPWQYYLKLAALFCAPYDYAGYWALQSFSPVALFSLMLLFAPRKKTKLQAPDECRNQLRTAFVLLLACLCIPLAGKIFNGMGYVTNRWSYGYAVIVCACVSWALPHLLDAELKDRRKLALAGFICAALMLIYGLFAHRIAAFEGGNNVVAVSDFSKYTKNIAGVAGGLALGAASACLWRLDVNLRMGRKRANRLFAGFAVLCCFAYSFGYALVAAGSVEFKDADIDAQIENQTVAAACRISDDGFYRIDAGSGTDNHAALLGYHGTGYYWSMIPEWISGHYTDLQLSSQRWTFRQEGLGTDSYLTALAGVKYSVRTDSEAAVCLPFGYEWIEDVTLPDGDTARIYENTHALPLGYVFDTVMTEAEYAELDPIEKRQALLSCAVLEEAQEGFGEYTPVSAAEKLTWEVAASDGVELVGNELRGRKNGTITLRFEACPDTETYLQLNGTRLLAVNDDTELRIDSRTSAGSNGMYIILPGGNFNYDQQGVCLRLGSGAEGISECVLRFATDGAVRFDSMEILSVPTARYTLAVENIRERGVWDAVPEGDCVEGEMHMDSAGILQISLPYSKGWTALVDGEEAPILRSGGMYMGLKLEAGEHQIALRYETPGLRAGAGITLAGVLIFIIAFFAGRRRAHQK